MIAGDPYKASVSPLRLVVVEPATGRRWVLPTAPAAVTAWMRQQSRPYRIHPFGSVPCDGPTAAALPLAAAVGSSEGDGSESSWASPL